MCVTPIELLEMKSTLGGINSIFHTAKQRASEPETTVYQKLWNIQLKQRLEGSL